MSYESYPTPPPPPTGYGAVPLGDPRFAPLPGATFGQAIQRFFQRYAQFRGRASRSEYWWSILGIVLATIVLEILTAINSNFGIIGILWLGLIVPALSIAVRRLHDTDRSGWWYFIGLIPLVGGIILLVWYCQSGKPEGARFDG